MQNQKNEKEDSNWKESIDILYNNIRISKVNLMSYIINSFLTILYKENKSKDKDKSCYYEEYAYAWGIKVKLYLMIIIAFIFILMKILGFSIFILSCFAFIIIMTILSIGLNFPFCYKNRKAYGTFGWCCNFLCFKESNNIFAQIFNIMGVHCILIL